MKKYLLIGLLAISCHTNAEVTPSPVQKQQLYQFFEAFMPTALFTTGYALFYEASFVLDTSGYPEKPISPYDPFDPRFTTCMNTAVKQKSYKPLLDQVIDNYLIEVTPSEFEQDLLFLQTDDIKAVSKAGQRMFKEFPKSQTPKQNKRLFELYEGAYQGTDHTNLEPSPSLNKYLDLEEETLYTPYVINKINQCYGISHPRQSSEW